ALMTLYGRTIHQAVATASAFGPMVAIPGALGFIWAGWHAAGLPPGSVGFVNLLGAAIIIPASVLAAPLGVRLAHGISRRRLELAFATFMAAIALRFFSSLVF
ncbi:MAG: TSUP family transporter, partial [Methyloligellaceae bacterium]